MLINRLGSVVPMIMVNGCPYVSKPFEWASKIQESIDVKYYPLLEIIRTLQETGPMVHSGIGIYSVSIQPKDIDMASLKAVCVGIKRTLRCVDRVDKRIAPPRESCVGIVTRTIDDKLIHQVWNIRVLQHRCCDPMTCHLCMDWLREPLPEEMHIKVAFVYLEGTWSPCP